MDKGDFKVEMKNGILMPRQSTRSKKVEPQVTISVAQLYHVWFISVSLLNFPKEGLPFFFPLSISAEHVHRASYSDLLGLDYT